MKNFTLLFVSMFVLHTIALSQSTPATSHSDTILLKKINTTLQQQFAHTKSNYPFSADSFKIEKDTLKVFFNTKKSFSRGAIPGGLIEMLPELLLHLTQQTNTTQLLLLAKNQANGQWKTLDYFSDEPEVKPYIEPANQDKFEPRKGKKNFQARSVFPTTSDVQQGILANKTVWLSPGHGWYNENGAGFTTQRGNNNELVEDFTTAESVDYYLTKYLYNAGANVWTVRERDVNTNEIIVDNNSSPAAYIETGTWVNGTIPGYGGTYRVAAAEANETATATFIANVVQSGYYWVSVRYISGANRTVDASYTVWHTGDSTTYHVNQEVHGNTWLYLGYFYFTAGAGNKVVISNKSSDPDQAVIADAVRLGGGIGQLPDCTNGGVSSSKPRFEESARQYAPYQGFTTCLNDVVTRPFYTEWELAKGDSSEIKNAVYVSWHTNAGGGTGTETYSYNGGGSSQPTITPGSVELRNYIHNQIVADIRAGWRSNWGDRGVKTANFGELRELRKIPGILMELAFHDLAADANELKHPEFRRLAARAIYKGIVKFFNNRDSIPLVFLPEEPSHVMAKNIGSAKIQLNWAAPATGGILGDAATGYKVYTSTNGRSFANGIPVTGTSYTFTGVANTTYYFKIAATNPGGESFTSSVVAARTPAEGSNPVGYLIVDGFDRLDRSALIIKNENPTLGNVKRMFLERMNRFDYMIEHAEALANCNISFDGCQNEVISSGSIALAGYSGIDWFTGEESTVDKSLDSTERTMLSSYLDNGGSLILSGSDIGWDIGRAASPNADLAFYNNYLKATYINDDANTYNFSGTPVFFVGQNGTFDNSTNGYYDVDAPDRIIAAGGSAELLSYSDGTADGAAVGFVGNYRLVYFAFPLEAITSASVRNNLMCNAVAFLTPTLPVKGLVLTGENTSLANKLTFETKAEINTKYFIVERSVNGIMFDSISPAISSKGSVNEGRKYVYADKNYTASAYYRIKAVDIDGKFSLSNTIFLKGQNGGVLFKLVANPSRENIRLEVFVNQPLTIVLHNSMGQVIYKESKAAGSGRYYTMPTPRLPKGMYSITVGAGNKTQTEKVLIQ